MRRVLFRCVFFIFLFLALLLGFFWWNQYPPLPLEGSEPVYQLFSFHKKSSSKVSIASYNIHFGYGLKNKITETELEENLDRIAKIIKSLHADIVFLQEVDFHAKRTFDINQAEWIAKKASYPYLATGILQKQKFFPDRQGRHGPIEQGLCILSRYPLSSNRTLLLPYSKETPFYLKWFFPYHGAQKVIAKIGKKALTLINVHLEPWCQKTRKKQIQQLHKWLKKSPLVLGGDLNTLSPEVPDKKGLYLSDAPWFIDKKCWNLENDATIPLLLKAGLIDAAPPSFYQRKEGTFPSYDPVEKIDYIFIKGAEPISFFTYKQAKDASDHLPIVARFFLTGEDAANDNQTN